MPQPHRRLTTWERIDLLAVRYHATDTKRQLLRQQLTLELAQWIREQPIETEALAYLRSQPFQGLGLLLPEELLPQLPGLTLDPEEEESCGPGNPADYGSST